MPNALNQGGVIRSYYAGQDDAAQVKQQNALGQMRQTQFDQSQQDRQREQQLEGIRSDLASYLVARKQGGPEAARAIWQQVAPKYGRRPDEDPETIVPEFIRANPGLLGDQASNAILQDYLAPKQPGNLPIEEVGVGNGMFQKAQVGPDGKLNPVGQPYRKAADASVDLRREAQDRKAQTEADKKAAARSALEAKYDYTLNLIDDLQRHPGLSTSVGAKGLTGGLMFGMVPPGTDAADFIARLDQLGGRQFLEAFESLKGGGQITQIEGEKATNAIARMQRSQSEEEFKKALTEFREVIDGGLRRLRGNTTIQPNAGTPTQPADNGGWGIRPL